MLRMTEGTVGRIRMGKKSESEGEWKGKGGGFLIINSKFLITNYP